MRFIEATIALVALASHAAAFEDEDGAWATLSQVDTGLKWRKHAAIEMKRTVLKFGGNVSEELEAAAAKAAKRGTVKNKPEALDALYTTPVTIGTPGKVHHMDIDTGSADLWTFSTFEPRSQRKGHTVYNPDASSTSKNLGLNSFNILYGDGSRARGPEYKDRVVVAGITVEQQALGAANKISGSFIADKQSDGIFGFGFSRINTVSPDKQKTWLYNARLKKKVICADLKHKKPGFYDVGFVNRAHFSGRIHYTPITRANGFWEFKVTGAKFGGKTVRHSIDAIADTGTSIALLPNAVLRPYYARIKGSRFLEGAYIYPCSAALPDFSIKIGRITRTIPGHLITFGPIGTLGGKEYCEGGLQKNTGLEGMSILGDTFLKSQYVIFDAENNRIGFANK